MLADIQENIVLYDWLTFTSKKHDPWELVIALGLEGCEWINRPGRYGYKEGLYFGHIGIYYDGKEDMGVCVDMSGQGCREFESYSILKSKWAGLFLFILQNKLNVSRLDIAFDDHTGILDIDRILEDTRKGYWVSLFRKYLIEESGEKGSEIQSKGVRLGTRQSKALVRIYDKAAERGYTDGRHWVRCEMQLRDERAAAFIAYGREVDDGKGGVKVEDVPMGEKFCGVLRNYLRFVEPTGNDSNIRRWAMADYWEDLCGSIAGIRLPCVPGAEYNVKALRKFVVNSCGNAIACAIEIFGVRNFLDMIRARTCRPNPKYELIVKQNNAHLELLAREAQERMNLESSMVEVEPGVFRSFAYVEWEQEQRRLAEDTHKDWVSFAADAPPLGGGLFASP